MEISGTSKGALSLDTIDRRNGRLLLVRLADQKERSEMESRWGLLYYISHFTYDGWTTLRTTWTTEKTRRIGFRIKR